MSGLQANTMLAYLAGAAVFVCAVMALFWGLQRVPPGYGMWAVSSALIGLACLLLVGREYFPVAVRTVLVPILVVVAAVFRLAGIGRFFRHVRLLRFIPLLPAVVLVLVLVFTYGRYNMPARTIVLTAAIALVFLATTGHLVREARRSTSVFLWILAGLFAAFGALWLSAGIHWLLSHTGFPLSGVDRLDIFFLAAITAFEFIWLVACLVLSARWRAGEIESARGRAEKERGQLADIVSFLPDAAFALDGQRRIIAWNRVMAEKTGIPGSAVVGVPWDESRVKELLGDEPTLSDVLLDPAKTLPGRCFNVQRDVDTISAEEAWDHPVTPAKQSLFWHTATILRDAVGEIAGTIETIRDVTWKAEAERAVRESEERYHSLFDHSLDGILVLAPGGVVADANPAACRMLGMSKEQICQADPSSFVGWAHDSEGGLSESAATGATVRLSTFKRSDGSTFPADCMSVVWDDSTGHLRAFMQFRDMTERVEAQRILRESQARLLDTPVSPAMGSWEIDLVGQSIWLSPEALHLFGLDGHSPYFPLEIGGLTGLIEESSDFSEALSRVMTEGGSYDVEYSIKRAGDGVSRKVRSVGAAVSGEGGTPSKVVGVTLDVTDSPVAVSMPDFGPDSMGRSDDQVFWVDPAGNIANVNESACLQLGYSREELMRMSIYQVNPRISPDSVDAPQMLKESSTRRHETVHRTKDGKDIPVEVTINYATHMGEEYKFVVAHDISERKRLEEILKLTRLSLERGGDMIFWSDAAGRLPFVTDAFCAYLGYSRVELLSSTILDIDLTAADDWSRVWDETVHQGAFARETRFLAKNGSEHPADVVFTHVEHEGRDYALAVVRDLTADRQGNPLAGTGVQGLQRERLEAVGQLAGGIAHDFNNLLTAIIGYGNLILANDETRGLNSLRKDAEEIRNAAERAAALTSQILAFARRQPLRPRRVGLSDLVAGLEARLRSMITDDVALSLALSPVAGAVEVDTEQFESVLVNLVQNACEAMPLGGRLVLGVEDVELGPEYCRAYPELQAGSYVVLSVSDTGMGMDADTKLRMFDPFFTTKPPGEGAGLGLSVVYGVIRQSGGNVVAYSEVGKGTTLKVYLPRVTGSADVQEGYEAESAGLATAGGQCVLVVEDEPPLRRLVARVLGQAGYRVFVAGSGPEALEMLDDMHAPPDLLITDVILPGGLQGNELAAKVGSRLPGLRVLYMSGHPRDTIVHAGRLDDGVCFLGKPFTPQVLVAKVSDVLRA